MFVVNDGVVSAEQTGLDGARSSVLDETRSRDGDCFRLMFCHVRRGVSRLACCLGSSLLEGKQP